MIETIVVVYIIGIILSYKFVTSKWNNSKIENIYYSLIWVLLIPLFIVHYIHNKA